LLIVIELIKDVDSDCHQAHKGCGQRYMEQVVLFLKKHSTGK